MNIQGASLTRLERAMQYQSANGRAPCVMWALALALDIRGDLIIATLPAVTHEERRFLTADAQAHASDVPFIHAWTEKDWHVYSPTLAWRQRSALTPIPVAEYYGVNKPSSIWRLTRHRVEEIDRRMRFSAALKYQRRRAAGQTVSAVLDAAGVRYRVVDGGLLPVEGATS